MRYHYRLAWEDDRGRLWATEVFEYDTPQEARAAHRESCWFGWVQPGMTDAEVTALLVTDNGRTLELEPAARKD